MTEKQMPTRIWATYDGGEWSTARLSNDRLFIRADLAERMAEALEKIDTAWTKDFPDGPDGSREVWGGLGQLSDWSVETWRQIRSALSAFRSATQDIEAVKHD